MWQRDPSVSTAHWFTMVNSDSAISGDTMEAIQLWHCVRMLRLWFTVPLWEEGRRPWIVLICITAVQSETVPQTCQQHFNFQGPQAQFRSSISSWLLWFLCKIILHLRMYFLTSLCTHTPPCTIYKFSPPLRTSKKNALSSTAQPAHTVAVTLHYWLQDESFLRLVQLF